MYYGSAPGMIPIHSICFAKKSNNGIEENRFSDAGEKGVDLLNEKAEDSSTDSSRFRILFLLINFLMEAIE